MKRIFRLLLIILLMLPMSVFADNKVINGNDFSIYQRSKEDIYNKWQTGKLNIPTNYNDIYETLPNYESPYRAGIVKQSYLDDLVDNLNYYRYLVGEPEITTKTSNDNELQTAEVVQNAYVNATNNITHYLTENWTKPNDMDEDFWNLGANADHNIISYNLVREPNFAFFDESIFDEYNPQAGHRNALLIPALTRVDYGIGNKIVYGRSTLDLDKYNNMDNSFAAYPSPGYFPKEDFADESDWDVYFNIYQYSYLTEESQNNIVVTIRNLTTGSIETRTLANNTLNFDFECEGNMCTPYNILHIKQPTRNTQYYNDSYEVIIKNIVKKTNNNETELVDIKYTVNFYDKYETAEANVVEGDFDLYLSGLFYDGEYDETLLSEALDGINLNLTLDTGYYHNAKVNSYNIIHDKKYSNFDIYHAYPIIDTLPNWINDPNNVIDNTILPIYGAYAEQNYRFQYGNMNYNKYIGEDVTISINGLNTGLADFNDLAEDGALFIWIKEKNGTFTILENPEEGETKYILTDDGLNLTIKNLTEDDEANYYVTALTYYEDYYEKYYFLSKPLSLTVNKKVSTISFENDTINLVINESKKITPTITPSDAVYTLSWISSDTNTVSVDNEGNIYGIKKGSATITVTTNNNKSATITVNVNDYKKGDMNKNNKLDLKDIIILIRKYLGSDSSNELDITIGDMNNNNKLDLKDIILLIKSYLGLE